LAIGLARSPLNRGSVLVFHHDGVVLPVLVVASINCQPSHVVSEVAVARLLNHFVMRSDGDRSIIAVVISDRDRDLRQLALGLLVARVLGLEERSIFVNHGDDLSEAGGEATCISSCPCALELVAILAITIFSHFIKLHFDLTAAVAHCSHLRSTRHIIALDGDGLIWQVLEHGWDDINDSDDLNMLDLLATVVSRHPHASLSEIKLASGR
jgi:hypothetical protein